MLLRFEAALNGKKFSEIAPEIILRDIVEIPSEEVVDLNRRGLHAGQMASGRTRLALSVRLVYVIRAYDIARRAEIRDLVAGWASNGGYLTINTRPYKRLHVKVDTAPSLESSLKWTQDLSITLTAYEQPYWEDADGTKCSISTLWSDEESTFHQRCVMEPLGNLTSTPLSCILFNHGSQTLTKVKISSNNTYIELTGLSVPPGGYCESGLEIRYTEDDVMEIVQRNADGTETSLLKNRTAESSDDILLKCGELNQVQVYTNVPMIGYITVRGRWY